MNETQQIAGQVSAGPVPGKQDRTVSVPHRRLAPQPGGAGRSHVDTLLESVA